MKGPASGVLLRQSFSVEIAKKSLHFPYHASMFTLFIFTKQVPRLKPGTVRTRAQGGLSAVSGRHVATSGARRIGS